MAILILINKTKAHNFNFHSLKSITYLQLKIFLPFGLGHTPPYTAQQPSSNHDLCTITHSQLNRTGSWHFSVES